MFSILASCKCPVCGLNLMSLTENCKRCGCDIAKLANIQYQAFRLKQKRQKHYKNVSQELYRFEAEEYLYLSSAYERKQNIWYLNP